MIIMMNDPTNDEINRVLEKIHQHGLDTHFLRSGGKVIITAVGDLTNCNMDLYRRMPSVEKVIPIITPFKLASREFKKENTVVRIGNVKIGSAKSVVIAGPCAVESYEQFRETAVRVKHSGACMLRGGAYKPRTSPYSFQGLEQEGLEILRTVSREVGLPVVSEITDARQIDKMRDCVDMLQIGARNMQNFALLKEVACADMPVLLKRGGAATIEEWLMAAEYILAGGNDKVVLCERGIRTFETYTRNTLDLAAVPVVKQLSHLPIIVDPSHGTGNWRLVSPMAKAALAAGADGLMIEVHPCPEEAVSDGAQSLTPHKFDGLMTEIEQMNLGKSD